MISNDVERITGTRTRSIEQLAVVNYGAIKAAIAAASIDKNTT
jgi:hypothetical protein